MGALKASDFAVLTVDGAFLDLLRFNGDVWKLLSLLPLRLLPPPDWSLRLDRLVLLTRLVVRVVRVVVVVVVVVVGLVVLLVLSFLDAIFQGFFNLSM